MSDLHDIEFYYCCACSSSYLAFVRVRETVIRWGVGLVFRPVVSAWLDAPEGRTDASHDSAAAAYARKDLQDWARFCGVRIEHPDRQSAVSAEWAQRGAVAAMDAGRIEAYVEATFQAIFSDGVDISDSSVVVDIAVKSGMSAKAFRRSLESERTLNVVQRNTNMLRERGGFRTPTMFIADDMYCGHERAPLLESALMQSTDRPFIAPGEHGR
ncbi:MAG TPA: DsbA family protein [Steroidobacter sp.]|uniref:DsbA family protein n=1 Tax=Steroidobacter sp. TaxID=1978227 RepID=UPI002ED9935F